MHAPKTTNFEQEILDAFKAFDHNGSGMISSQELHNALTRIGQKMDPKAAASFIRAADHSGSGGMINYRELSRLLTR